MPVIKNAKKALIQSQKRKIRNDHFRKKYTLLRRAFEKDIRSNELENPQKRLAQVYSILDTLAKKNIFHKNKASRYKARFAKMLKTTASTAVTK